MVGNARLSSITICEWIEAQPKEWEKRKEISVLQNLNWFDLIYAVLFSFLEAISEVFPFSRLLW